jgi:hypothetical protein
MSDDDLIKKVNIQKIASEGSKIYEKIKAQYEPKYNSKFLAIDIASKDVFMGETSADALVKAKTKYPNKVFYVVKIGFEAAETVAKSYFQ